jgi:DNA-binding IclR family transcriptional regulator
MILPEGMGVGRPGIVLVWNALFRLSLLDGIPIRTTIKQIAVLSGVHPGSSGKLLRDLREQGFVKYDSLGKSGILVMEL